MDTDERRRIYRRRLPWVLTPIVVLTALAYVGDVSHAALVESHPLWLIALNTRKRYLALVVPHTDAWSFYLVGTVRQLLSDPLFFVLGRWYGDAGVRWLERRLGDSGRVVGFLERGFARAAWPMVAFVPNALISMLAGASSMPVWLFLALNLGGTLVSMALLRAFGVAFAGPLEAVTGFLSRNRWPIIALSAVIVGANIALNRRRGRREIDAVSTLEAELDSELDAVGDDRTTPPGADEAAGR